MEIKIVYIYQHTYILLYYAAADAFKIPIFLQHKPLVH